MTKHDIELKADPVNIQSPQVKVSTDSAIVALSVITALFPKYVHMRMRSHRGKWSNWQRVDDLGLMEDTIVELVGNWRKFGGGEHD